MNPEQAIGEVLGLAATHARGMAIAPNATCPFASELYDSCCRARVSERLRQCSKRSRVCAIYEGTSGPERPGQLSIERLISICPSRLVERHVIDDVVDVVWGRRGFRDYSLATEVRLGQHWNVDFVLAELEDTTVRDFVSIEVQAIDTTGDFKPFLRSLLANEPTVARPKSYGLNWANATIKRLFTQLLFKGYMHHVWRRRIAVVIQDTTLDYIERVVPLSTVPTLQHADIVLMPYKYVHNNASSYGLELDLSRVKRMPYGSFALATLGIEVSDLEQVNRKIAKRVV